MTLGAFSDAALAVCEANYQRCRCGASTGADQYDYVETCLAVDRYQLGEDVKRIAEMVSRGAAAYDPQAAARCLEEIEAADCGVEDPPCGGLSSVLWHSLTPLVPLGGACVMTSDCAEGACGREDGAKPYGHCVPNGPGDPCVVWCGDSVSVSSEGPYDSCTRSCGAGLAIVQDGDQCTCEPKPPVAVLGEPCEDDPWSCEDDDGWCDAEANLCKPRAGLGEPCVDSFARFRARRDQPGWIQQTCEDGLFCDPGTETCAERGAFGDPCDPTGNPDQCRAECGKDGMCGSKLCR